MHSALRGAGEKKNMIRSSFMKLFTTSKMGLAIKDTGRIKIISERK
jgi:hypothetical protein